MKDICPYCKKKFKRKSPAQKYCTKECCRKDYREKNKEKIRKERREYYENHKEQYLETARRWEKNNPRKAKQVRKKALLKFRTEKRERFNELMRNSYRRNKAKHGSRVKVYKLLRVYKKKIMKLNKVCHVCDSRYNVWLFYDIYPLTKENVLKALKQGKVRYLCRIHWREASKKRRQRYLREQKKKNKITNDKREKMKFVTPFE